MAKSDGCADDGTAVLHALTGRTVRVAFPPTAVDLPARISGAGVEEHAGSRYHWHGLRREREDLAVVQHTLAGEGRLQFGSTLHRLGPGRTMVVPVPHDHRYWCPDGGTWRFCWLILTGREAVRLVRHLVDRRGPVFDLPPAAVGALADTCRTALAGGWRDPWAASAAAWSTLMALGGAILAGADPGIDDPVARARTWARAHLAEPITAADLAAVAGLSRSHFSRAFAKATGQAPRDWLEDLRLREAMARLRAGESVVAAGRAVGYRDPAYFCRAFRRALGLTPGAYRDGTDPRRDGPPPAGNHPAG
jgi:AraC family transcriptional regulator